MSRRLLRRHVALPDDHGSWVFLLLPLAVGLVDGGRWRTASGYLAVAALGAFLLRQPLAVAVKVMSRRRPWGELPAALFWSSVWGGLAALHALGLALRGHGEVLMLALPGGAIFACYLVLVARRAERRQELLEVLAAAALALAAPAARWIGRGGADPEGWWLWLLLWLQAAASIAHVHLRLAQRTRRGGVPARARRRVTRSLAWALLAVAAPAVLGPLLGRPWLAVPFLLQAGENLFGVLRPAVPGTRPQAVGVRQLAVSVTFGLGFLLVW